jgi:hypothetical protein
MKEKKEEGGEEKKGRKVRKWRKNIKTTREY